MTQSEGAISDVIHAPLALVKFYLSSPGGLLRLLQAQHAKKLPPRSATMAELFSLREDGVDGQVVTYASIQAVRKGAPANSSRRLLTRLKNDCERLATYALPPKRIVVSGANGLIGSTVLPLLVAGGHEVTRLVRVKPSADVAAVDSMGTKSLFWQPTGQGASALDPAALEGTDAIVHLAGEPVSNGRWTAKKLAAIRDSRVESTKLIAKTLQQMKSPPKVLVCASGVHAYGDRGDEELTESSDIGSGYLAEVVRDWEAAASAARDLGVRVVFIRWGLVVGRSGGAVATMLPLFRLGLGAIPSPGTQWWPWVSIDDAIGQVMCALARSDVSGAINGVSPKPATANEFCKVLASTLDRPLLARLPRWMLKAVAKGQEEVICTSTRAMPAKLRHVNFHWIHESLEDALKWELGA